MECQGWKKVGYEQPQLVQYKLPDDRVQAEFEPNKRCGWQIFNQGNQSVGFQRFLCGSFQCIMCA